MAWGRGAAAAPTRAPTPCPGPRGRLRAGGSRLLGPAWGASSAFGGVPAAGGPGSGARGAPPRREDCVCKMAAPRWPRHDGCRRPAAASVRLRGQMQRPLAPGPLADEGWPPFASRVMMMMGGDGKTVSRAPARPPQRVPRLAVARRHPFAAFGAERQNSCCTACALQGSCSGKQS